MYQPFNNPFEVVVGIINPQCILLLKCKSIPCDCKVSTVATW